MSVLPSGIVTFLFTDIEGSTRLWETDPAAMRMAVARHLALLGEAIAAGGGLHFKTIGDSVQAAFGTPDGALTAAVAGQQALAAADWGTIGPPRVRMAVHAGSATPVAGDYLAPCLNRLSRLLSIGHGEQILLTETARRLLEGSLPAGASLRDLGEHRLRDLLEPERVWQVLAPGLPDQFPPLRSLEIRPHNLPAPPTPLIGREEEVATLQRLLGTEGVRLVTLTGPGGSGKTRLALETGAELLESFPRGVWFVDLATLADPALLLRQVAAVLGIRESGSQPLLDQIATALGGTRMLLLLDNLEQFRPFTTMSRVVADLLAAVSGLAVLATSRAPLRLRLERELPVPPLPVPSPNDQTIEALAASPAVQLFLDRAQAARPGFALSPQTGPAIAALCRRLDGLPLALELAAARVRALSPADILARLGDRLDLLTDRGADRPDRQRTLETTIAWSFDLLAPDEQAALRRVAVFSGFTLAAAEAVLDSVVPPTDDALMSLEILIEHSLVRAEQQSDGSLRYRLLETVRTFALERLRGSGEEDAARQAHAAHFAQFGAIDWEREVRLLPILETVEPESGNLREALVWAETGRHSETGLLLANAFGNLAYHRGQMAEGREWLERLLALDVPAPAALKAKALNVLGWTALFQGDTDMAKACAVQTMDVPAAEPSTVASVLNLFACVLWDQGFEGEARRRFEEALSVAGRLYNAEGLRAAILTNFGLFAATLGDRQQARHHFETALAGLPIDEVSFSRPILLTNLAYLAWEDGDRQRSALFTREALTLGRALGNRFIVANNLERAAHQAIVLGRSDTAARILGASDVLRQTIGVPVEPQNVKQHQQLIAETLKLLGEAAFARAWSEGEALSLDEAVTEADRILAKIVGSADETVDQTESSATRPATGFP